MKAQFASAMMAVVSGGQWSSASAAVVYSERYVAPRCRTHRVRFAARVESSRHPSPMCCVLCYSLCQNDGLDFRLCEPHLRFHDRAARARVRRGLIHVSTATSSSAATAIAEERSERALASTRGRQHDDLDTRRSEPRAPCPRAAARAPLPVRRSSRRCH